MMELKPYRSYRELLRDAENVTDHHEMIRLGRIRQTPETVRLTLERRADELQRMIMELEKELDVILDFLNGEGGKE